MAKASTALGTLGGAVEVSCCVVEGVTEDGTYPTEVGEEDGSGITGGTYVDDAGTAAVSLVDSLLLPNQVVVGFFCPESTPTPMGTATESAGTGESLECPRAAAAISG